MILALLGTKGGTGKTTLAMSLAVEWAERGRRVRVRDADPRKHAVRWAAAAEAHGHPRLDVAPLPVDGAIGADDVDLFIIDGGSADDRATRRAALYADVVLVPCGTSALDAHGCEVTVDLVRRASSTRPRGAPPIAAVLTRRIPRTAIGATTRRELLAKGIPVLDVEIGHRVAYQECPAFGLGVTAYAPMSPAADEIRALADEIVRLRAALAPRRPETPRPLARSLKDIRAYEETVAYEPNVSGCLG